MAFLKTEAGFVGLDEVRLVGSEVVRSFPSALAADGKMTGSS